MFINLFWGDVSTSKQFLTLFLQEELAEVIDENTKLQQSMEEAYRGSEALKTKLEASRKDVMTLKKQLSSVNSDIEQMKHKKDSLADDKLSLAAHVQQLQTTGDAHAQETARLQQVLAGCCFTTILWVLEIHPLEKLNFLFLLSLALI